MKRVLVGVGIVIGAIAVLTVVGVFLFTMTDFGRERVRRFTLQTLSEMVHGQVRIGGIGGNLLDGVVMTDFSIADTAGRPFVSADTVIADYHLIAFARKRIELHSLRLVRPLVISNATRMPFLLVVFGVLGGVLAFGLVGLFIGPVLLAVSLAIWREWLEEHRPKEEVIGS